MNQISYAENCKNSDVWIHTDWTNIYIYRRQMQVYLSDGQGGGTTRQFEEEFSIDAW